MATLNIKNMSDELYYNLRVHAEQQHRSISQEVIHALTMHLARNHKHSILDLRGLGKEIWSDIIATTHVDEERASWE